MLLPLFIIVAVVNIVAKNNNYYIKTPRNPDFDVRVKRGAGFSELENERNEYSVILNELNELIKIYIDNDENYTNLSRREPDRSRNVVSDVNTSGGVKELRNNATTRKEIAFSLNELIELITEYNNYDKTHPNDTKRVKRNVESSIPVTDDLNSDTVLELHHNKVWRKSAAKNIENLWNNITAEMNKLAELMAQYEDTDLDKKVKREVDRDKNIDGDKNIRAEVTELNNNTKVWKEIASVVDEIKVLLTKFNDDIGEKPNISRVSRVADNAKIKENDVGTSVAVTELNTRLLKDTELILSEIQELISKYKKSISDIKEPRERQPDSRAKREVKLPIPWNFSLGPSDKLVGYIYGYNTNIEDGDTEPKEKSLSQIPLENVGLSPKETNTEQMVPKNEITPKKHLKEKKQQQQEEELNLKEIEMEHIPLKDVELFNEPVQPDHITEKNLDNEYYREDIPRQEKLEINKDEIEKISENIDTDIPEKPIEKFDTVSDEVGKVEPNIGFEKDDHIDTNKRCYEFKNYDEMKTLKILKAFDDIDGLLEIHVLESSFEEEKITDDKIVIKQMESGQQYQLVVDYTDVRKPNDVSSCMTPKIKNIPYKTNLEIETPKKSLLKPIINKEQNKIITDFSSKLTNTKRSLFNRFKPESIAKDNIKIPKRSTFLKILEDSTLLNKKRVNREASPGNSVSNFFSSIYTKIYDMTHPKKDKDDNNDLLLRDDGYNSYGNMSQQNNININQNRNNKFGNNRINDNKLTHSDYTHIDNNYNNYGNGYGSTNNGSSYKPTQGSGYDYNTGYGSNNYNTKPDNGYRYNVTDFNNKGTSTTTEQTIVQGCIFCGNYGCQKNYRWMGVACVPTKRKK